MVTEKFCMNVRAVGSDDGIHTYEIHRKWAEKGKKSLVIELYPTITVSKCGSMDVSTMHLLNHVQELGWGEVRIVNLYSKVFSEKPKVKQLTDNDNNLSYIEEILEEQDIKDYDIVIAWGNTLLSHTDTIHAKMDLLTMMKSKGLVKQVKCIVTENMEAEGVHPLYLGLRYSKDSWKLKPYPLEKVLHELGSEGNKDSADSDKKKSAESDGKKSSESDENKSTQSDGKNLLTAIKRKRRSERMYLRIKNKMDAEIMREALKAERLDGAVINRIDKIVGVLDMNYGGCRGSSDMGGYILLFTDRQTYEKNIMKIMEFYHLNKELYEYSNKLGSEGNDMAEWQEELYLLSSDDALVIIHPVVQGDV